MSPTLATILFGIGIAGLFFLDRDRSIRTSKALWLPVIWLWIIGSRSVAEWLLLWFGWSQPGAGRGMDAQLDGSPADAAFFGILLAAGATVLFLRRDRTIALLKSNIIVLIYFAYCLLTVFWAPYPEVTFKRCIKDIGDLIIVLVVLTETEPVAALRRLLSRVGFVLLPASIFLIKYSPNGHEIDVWGNFFNTGVTTNKNSLGLLVWVCSLGAVWNLQMLLRDKNASNRGRRLLAQGTLLAFGLMLLDLAHSATSISCFILGSILILATGLRPVRRSPMAVHAVVLGIVAIGGLTFLLGGAGAAAHVLGRQSDLTGRTEIWTAVIQAAPNPIFGVGFESFWISPAVTKVYEALPGWTQALNTAHNGYIETYVNLGWVGVCLMALLLVSGYRGTVASFRSNPEVGSLMLVFVATAAIYSITEAGFRMLSLSWFFLLLAVVSGSSIVASNARRRAQRSRDLRRGLARDPDGRSAIPRHVAARGGIGNLRPVLPSRPANAGER